MAGKVLLNCVAFELGCRCRRGDSYVSAKELDGLANESGSQSDVARHLADCTGAGNLPFHTRGREGVLARLIILTTMSPLAAMDEGTQPQFPTSSATAGEQSVPMTIYRLRDIMETEYRDWYAERTLGRRLTSRRIYTRYRKVRLQESEKEFRKCGNVGHANRLWQYEVAKRENRRKREK
jgi:hypothetical protein